MTRGELLASLVSHDDLSTLIVRLNGERVHSRLMALAMSAPWPIETEVHYWFHPGRYTDGVQVELQRVHGGSIYG